MPAKKKHKNTKKEAQKPVEVEEVVAAAPVEPVEPPVEVPAAVPPSSRHVPSMVWSGVYTVFIIGALLGSLFLYQQSIPSNTKAETVPMPTVSLPTEEPKKEVKIAEYPITVLNGSGIQGEATRVKNVLEKDGFTVMEVGNATRRNYKETIIQSKKEVSDEVIIKLKESLYEFELTTEVLDDTEEADIIIIIGATKAP